MWPEDAVINKLQNQLDDRGSATCILPEEANIGYIRFLYNHFNHYPIVEFSFDGDDMHISIIAHKHDYC